MIKNLQISGVHSQLTQKMHAYVLKKIGGLDRYIPKSARESVHTEVKLKETSVKDKRSHECEVIMKLPKGTITVHKKGESILAAIDEVENNLKIQIKKYKDTHAGPRSNRRLISRFKRTEIPEAI